jgi:hypothetical protein
MPPAQQIASFVGDAIAQIRLDPHAVQLAFESMRQIDVNERLEHVEPDGTVWKYACDAANGEPILLHRLLYKRIVAAKREDLHITFEMEDGSSLSIFSEIGPCESGVIWEAERVDWVVF